MSETEPSVEKGDKLLSDYQLYLLVGVVSAIVAWFMIPLVGLVTVYCGYQLFSEESRRLSAGAFTIAGGLPVVTWVAWIIQMYV